MPRLPIHAQSALLTIASALGAAGFWHRALNEEGFRLMLSGTLCGSSKTILGHCAACYPAAALTMVAIGGGMLWLAQTAKAIHRPAAPTVTHIRRLA